MLDAPERVDSTADEAEHPAPQVAWWRSLHATSTRRALLLTALGGLLIAGRAHRAAAAANGPVAPLVR